MSELKPKKKWILPVCIGAAVLVLSIMAVVMVAILKVTPKKEPEQTKVEKVKETYPKEIHLEEDVQGKLVELVDLVCKMESAEGGHRLEKEHIINEDFASIFLLDSIWFGVPFDEGNAVEGWRVSESVTRKYLKNSIGIEKFTENWSTVSDGWIESAGVQVTSSYANDTPEITKVEQVSKNEIQVSGKVSFTPEIQGNAPYQIHFDLIFTQNEESIWGGYTLLEILRWEEARESVENVPEQEKPAPPAQVADTPETEMLKRFIYLLGELHYRGLNDDGVKALFENDPDIFGSRLLFFALYDELDLMKEHYHVAELSEYWEIPSEQLDLFLIDSVGRDDFYGEFVVTGSEGYVGIGYSDPPYVGEMHDLQIERMDVIADQKILVQGSLNYEDYEMGTLTPFHFQLTMRENPGSIWGGYTLVSIDKWE